MTPNAIDLEKLIRLFETIYSHALTCQELLENPELEYETLKAKNDVLSAQQFALLYRGLNEPEAFAKAVREFQGLVPMPGKTQ